MMSGLASEIVIVDVNKNKAEGEAMDLVQGESFVEPVSVKAGGLPRYQKFQYSNNNSKSCTK